MWVGCQGKELLAEGARLSAGVMALPEDMTPEYKPSLTHFLFAVLVQKSPEVVPSLAQIWNNIREDLLTDLTPVNFQRMREVSKDWVLGQYEDLIARIQKIDWQNMFTRTFQALKALRSSA